MASYAQEVRNGKSYIYRVLSPERTTLELRWRGAALTIGQFRLARNRRPAAASWLAVEAWLAQGTAEGEAAGSR